MKRFLVLIVGIAFIAIGGFIYYRDVSLTKKCTVEAVATVVDMKQELSTDSDSASSYMYYPIVEYQAGDDTVRVTTDNGSSRPAYKIDEKITILYNPKKTNQFIVKGDKTLNVFAIVFMVIGAFVSVYGIKEAIKKD